MEADCGNWILFAISHKRCIWSRKEDLLMKGCWLKPSHKNWDKMLRPHFSRFLLLFFHATFEWKSVSYRLGGCLISGITVD